MSPTMNRQEDLAQLALVSRSLSDTADTHPHPTSAQDVDEMMDGIQMANHDPYTPNTPPTQAPKKTATPLTIKAPGPTSYANALKRAAEQTEDVDQVKEREEFEAPDEGETEERTTNIPPWPKYASSGPIKGFSTEQILKNLDPVVRETWEGQMDTAIFVHYLDGGYSMNIAQNVHTIAEDLKSKHQSKDWQ
jgi:hypothetical protein